MHDFDSFSEVEVKFIETYIDENDELQTNEDVAEFSILNPDIDMIMDELRGYNMLVSNYRNNCWLEDLEIVDYTIR